jgi:hypothetical protein
MKTEHSLNEQYVFEGKAKTWSLVAILVGVVCVALGFVVNAERTFSNLLLMGYYFTCVCTAGAVFCAIQYAAQAGWSAAMIRIPQAFTKVLPIAAVILIAIIASGMFMTHQVTTEEGKTVTQPYLFAQWATKGLTDPSSPNYDPDIAGKAGYLNFGFYYVRLIGFLLLYSLLGWMLVKYSENEDEFGGMSNYKKSFNVSCVLLVVFGVTFPLFSFDSIMSLEASWYSTMFGWYNLAAAWVSGLAAITLVMVYLKDKGHFSWLNENHLHNMGLFMFAFSIFWTYVWFFQFLLYYYANIPEETAYFYRRWEPEFKPWFWLNIVINFAAPFLMLMARDYKRITKRIKWVAIIILLGHWLDYYMMIMPDTVGAKGRGFNFEEVGIFIGFAGLFWFLALNALSKFKSLVPKNHPFLEESLHHHI